VLLLVQYIANIFARRKTKYSPFEVLLLVVDQFELLLSHFSNVKSFAARLNKILCFCSQFQKVSLRGETKYSAFVRFFAVWQRKNTPNLSYFCPNLLLHG
jgi:hypothetical protein